MEWIKIFLSPNLYIGIAFGGLATVVYFTYTGTKLIWKKD